MEEQKKSLFEDSKPASQVVGGIEQERMFISGDLSSYALPEEFLKEKKEIPDFWKGFLFTIFCGFLMIIMTFLIGLSMDIDDDDDDSERTFFVSDGIETNISYQFDEDSDLDCWDIDFWIEDSDINLYTNCWSAWKDDDITGKIYPIQMYENDIEIGVLDFGASEIEINLPYDISNNSNVTFIFDYWDYERQESITEKTTYIITNETNSTSTFLVNLPPDYGDASRLDLVIEIKEGSEENSGQKGKVFTEWVGKQSNCWYQNAKCTFTVGKESEVGFIDLKSQILVIILEEPLPLATSIVVDFDNYDDFEEETLLLFFWLPPILFTIGIIMMIYNKKSQMVGGSFAALLPVFVTTFIGSLIIIEMFGF